MHPTVIFYSVSSLFILSCDSFGLTVGGLRMDKPVVDIGYRKNKKTAF